MLPLGLCPEMSCPLCWHRISPQVLKDIWDLADASSAGALDIDGFRLAMRLMAMVQMGIELRLRI